MATPRAHASGLPEPEEPVPEPEAQTALLLCESSILCENSRMIQSYANRVNSNLAGNRGLLAHEPGHVLVRACEAHQLTNSMDLVANLVY
jgi:hypothetical protein